MKKFFKKLWNNKVFRTFLQAFLGVIGAGFTVGMDNKALFTLVATAISSGLCAAMNVGSYESK